MAKFSETAKPQSVHIVRCECVLDGPVRKPKNLTLNTEKSYYNECNPPNSATERFSCRIKLREV